jgi:hypothetical protein
MEGLQLAIEEAALTNSFAGSSINQMRSILVNLISPGLIAAAALCLALVPTKSRAADKITEKEACALVVSAATFNYAHDPRPKESSLETWCSDFSFINSRGTASITINYHYKALAVANNQTMQVDEAQRCSLVRTDQGWRVDFCSET